MFYTWVISFALMGAGFGASLADGDVNALSVGCVVVWLVLFAFFVQFNRLAPYPPALPVRVQLATGDTLDVVARRRWRRDEHGCVRYSVRQFDGSPLPDLRSDAVTAYDIPIIGDVSMTFYTTDGVGITHMRGHTHDDD